MGGQDSNLNFKLLPSLRILKRSRHFCDNINNINIFSMYRRSFIENSAPHLYLLRIVYHHLSKWQRSGRKLGVAYLEINELPCLHEIDKPKCINV
jgi:hypothetical protein